MYITYVFTVGIAQYIAHVIKAKCLQGCVCCIASPLEHEDLMKQTLQKKHVHLLSLP